MRFISEEETEPEVAFYTKKEAEAYLAEQGYKKREGIPSGYWWYVGVMDFVNGDPKYIEKVLLVKGGNNNE